MSESAPRVTQPLLQHFSHRTVRLVGKVRQLRGEQAVIDADGQVTLHLHRDAHLQLNHAVEIIGKVQQDFSVRVMASENLGPEGNVGEWSEGSLGRGGLYLRSAGSVRSEALADGSW